MTKMFLLLLPVTTLLGGCLTPEFRDLPPPSDYPAPVGAESHLKAVWVKLR